MNLLLGGMVGDGPPEPPPQRTRELRIIIPWFSVAAGTMLLISRIEAGFLQDADPLEDRRQLAWRLLKHLSIPGLLGSLLVLHGLALLMARGKKLQAARLGVVVGGLLSFAIFTKLGWLGTANAQAALLVFCLLLMAGTALVGRVLGWEEEPEAAAVPREPVVAEGGEADDSSVVHHSASGTGQVGGPGPTRRGAAAAAAGVQ